MKFIKNYIVELISCLLLILFAISANAQAKVEMFTNEEYAVDITTIKGFGTPIREEKQNTNFEVGYLIGGTKQGINPASAQPIYGITLQKQFSKNVSLESNVFYSQRMNGKAIQSDYLSFMLLAKFGYFGNKAGVYVCYGLALNPSLTHANNENHTYGSFTPAIGAQLKLFGRTWIELKGIYDCGLSGAYLKEGCWSDYGGLIIMSTLKFRLWNQ